MCGAAKGVCGAAQGVRQGRSRGAAGAPQGRCKREQGCSRGCSRGAAHLLGARAGPAEQHHARAAARRARGHLGRDERVDDAVEHLLLERAVELAEHLAEVRQHGGCRLAVRGEAQLDLLRLVVLPVHDVRAGGRRRVREVVHLVVRVVHAPPVQPSLHLLVVQLEHQHARRQQSRR